MTLPQNFDQNEWFIIISLLLFWGSMFLSRKTIPISITILILLFSSSVARLFDHLLAGPSLDLYDIMDKGSYELFDLFLYLLYCPFTYFFVYFYNKYKLKGAKLWLYLMLSAVFGTAFEWFASKVGVFNYKGWRLTYSFTVYLIVQPLTLWFFSYIMKVYRSNNK